MGIRRPFCGLMALPQSLSGLALWLGKADTDGLVISCYYCNNILSQIDKILYDNGQLGIIWKDGRYYAACFPCVRTSARLDFMRNYETVCSPGEVQLRSNCSLLDLNIRCLSCLRVLNRSEKRDVLSSQQDIFQVRGDLRTICVICTVGL